MYPSESSISLTISPSLLSIETEMKQSPREWGSFYFFIGRDWGIFVIASLQFFTEKKKSNQKCWVLQKDSKLLQIFA